jgi:hypothetical protein
MFVQMPRSDQVLPVGLLVRHVGDASFTASSEAQLQHRFDEGAVDFVCVSFHFHRSASGGCAFEREIEKGNDDRLFFFTASNATFEYTIGPDSAGLSVITFANCYSNYLAVSYSVNFDIVNPGGVRVSAGALVVCALAASVCHQCSRTHAGAGDAALPSVFFAFACFMAFAAALWARELSRNSAHVVGIHRVMGALVTIKSVWLAVSSFHWYLSCAAVVRLFWTMC